MAIYKSIKALENAGKKPGDVIYAYRFNKHDLTTPKCGFVPPMLGILACAKSPKQHYANIETATKITHFGQIDRVGPDDITQPVTIWRTYNATDLTFADSLEEAINCCNTELWQTATRIADQADSKIASLLQEINEDWLKTNDPTNRTPDKRGIMDAVIYESPNPSTATQRVILGHAAFIDAFGTTFIADSFAAGEYPIGAIALYGREVSNSTVIQISSTGNAKTNDGSDMLVAIGHGIEVSYKYLLDIFGDDLGGVLGHSHMQILSNI